MASFPQKVTRLVFDITGRISPDFAGRLAFRLFTFTPSRNAGTQKAQDALQNARQRMTGADSVRLVLRNGSITAFRFVGSTRVNSAETVLVVHGWGSRTEHMIALIEALVESGRNVVAIDLPGHGRSSGRTLNMANAVEALDAAWREFGPFNTVVGHSFGGAVALNSAGGTISGIPARIPRRLVLISAPSDIPRVFDMFSHWIGLSEASKQVLFRVIHEIAERPVEHFAGTGILAGIAIPTLVLHAPDDKEVPSQSAEDFGLAGPHVRVEWAPGLGHRRILNDTGIHDRIRHFISAPTARRKNRPVIDLSSDLCEKATAV